MILSVESYPDPHLSSDTSLTIRLKEGFTVKVKFSLSLDHLQFFGPVNPARYHSEFLPSGSLNHASLQSYAERRAQELYSAIPRDCQGNPLFLYDWVEVVNQNSQAQVVTSHGRGLYLRWKDGVNRWKSYAPHELKKIEISSFSPRKLVPPKLKEGQRKPIVDAVFTVLERPHSYVLAPLAQYSTLYQTDATVRVQDWQSGELASCRKSKVYCVPNDSAWSELLGFYTRFQRDLVHLANGLRDLGLYSQRLMQLGNRDSTTPICSTIIAAEDPDDYLSGFWAEAWSVPSINRIQVVEQRPKTLIVPKQDVKTWHSSVDSEETTYVKQKNHFYCPDDTVWETIEQLHAQALESSKAIQECLLRLGTYEQAERDDRYFVSSVSSSDYAIALPSVSSSETLGNFIGEAGNSIAQQFPAFVLTDSQIMAIARWKDDGWTVQQAEVDAAKLETGEISVLVSKSVCKDDGQLTDVSQTKTLLIAANGRQITIEQRNRIIQWQDQGFTVDLIPLKQGLPGGLEYEVRLSTPAWVVDDLEYAEPLELCFRSQVFLSELGWTAEITEYKATHCLLPRQIPTTVYCKKQIEVNGQNALERQRQLLELKLEDIRAELWRLQYQKQEFLKSDSGFDWPSTWTGVCIEPYSTLKKLKSGGVKLHWYYRLRATRKIFNPSNKPNKSGTGPKAGYTDKQHIPKESYRKYRVARYFRDVMVPLMEAEAQVVAEIRDLEVSRKRFHLESTTKQPYQWDIFDSRDMYPLGECPCTTIRFTVFQWVPTTSRAGLKRATAPSGHRFKAPADDPWKIKVAREKAEKLLQSKLN